MDQNALIDLLEELVESFGVRIRYERIRDDDDSTRVAGGLCLLKGEYILIINSKTMPAERIRILAEASKHFDLEGIYIRPVIRELLGNLHE